MESKKLNKKLSSIFWFLLGSLPLIVFLLTVIGYLLVFKETGSNDLFNDSFNLLNISIVHVSDIFTSFKWNVLFDTFTNVFSLVGFNISGPLSIFLVILFTWYIQISFIHILVDIVLFVPRLVHNFMERWS